MSSPHSPSQPWRHAVLLSALVLYLIIVVGCGGGGGGNGFIGGGTPTPTPTPTPVPTPTPTPPIGPSNMEVSVGNAVVPAGGIYQYQVLLTEPKPIGNSSSRPTLPTTSTGTLRGVAVNDTSGQAAGVVVVDATGTVSVKLISPNGTLGTDNTYPLFTMTMPVNATAVAGQSFPATLDLASFQDGTGNTYTILANTPGTLTIGDSTAQSVTDVIPGGGLLPDRSVIRVLGLGFTANTRIAIEGTTVLFPADTTFVSANEIDVKICNGIVDPLATVCPNSGGNFQLDGERVRVTNRDTGVNVDYYTYARTDDESGVSATPLAAQSHAMFSRQTYAMATIPYLNDATHFTGFALQNTTAVDATFNVELLDKNGALLPNSAQGVTLRAGKRIVRDIQDWIASIPATAATVRVTVASGPPKLQMLGLVGDTALNTVTPIIVTGQ
jgi:hypothetical protein